MGAINSHHGLLLAGGSGAVYLSDLPVTPRCCLSLRKLISTATVSIRVRRSSDNAEQDIGFSGSALDTAALSSFVGSSSAYVTTFYDQTGNAQHAVQATTTKQPRIVNAGTYDGKLVFDGTASSMKVASLALASPQAAIYNKLRLSANGATKIVFETSANYNNNAGGLIVFSDGVNNLHLATSQTAGSATNDWVYSAFDISAALSQCTFMWDRAQAASGEISLYRGGVSQTKSAVSAVDCTGNMATYDCYIGGRAGASLYADIWLETSVFYGVDTSSIRASIEAIVA